tara:strand:- start:14744 stop:14893 length:150 start_codon:yes stop_codon:yes gene_type:complete
MSKAQTLFKTLLEYRERKKIMSDVMRAIDEYVKEVIKETLENEKRNIKN